MKRIAEYVPSSKRLHYWVTPTHRIARVCETLTDARVFLRAHTIETEIVQTLEVRGS